MIAKQAPGPRTIVIRPYRPAEDFIWLHALWHKVFDHRWTLQQRQLEQSLSSSTMAFVAKQHGLPIGMCAAVHQPSGRAGLLAILVEPPQQRQGAGVSLLARIERQLSRDGCSALTLGFGPGGEYFWPGVPALESPAWPFFAKHGWRGGNRTFDLVLELPDYQAPTAIYKRVQDQKIVLGPASPLLRDRLLEFEQRSFPAWAPYFEDALRRSDYSNILVACDPDGCVVGSVLLDCLSPLTWRHTLGSACGP